MITLALRPRPETPVQGPDFDETLRIRLDLARKCLLDDRPLVKHWGAMHGPTSMVMWRSKSQGRAGLRRPEQL